MARAIRSFFAVVAIFVLLSLVIGCVTLQGEGGIPAIANNRSLSSAAS